MVQFRLDGLTKTQGENTNRSQDFLLKLKDNLIDSPILILMFFIPSYNKNH